MKIYAEWTINGEFQSALFNSWSEYIKATFNVKVDKLIIWQGVWKTVRTY